MFDSFMGLPLHVLVLHFAVVLIPLGALVTVAVILVPKLRDKFIVPVAGLNLGLLALTFVTVRAGISFKHKLDPTGQGHLPTHEHEDYGTTLLWVMVALAVMTLLVAAAVKKTAVPPLAISGVCGIITLVAIGSVVLTVITGHTGSESHWGYLYMKH